ncbi:MAG TPA: VWA domain-containing protein [Pyrinomonadaceae bacterium]|nr:VWA domain-containing protein [Pyrinomonadaceae bacterium]
MLRSTTAVPDNQEQSEAGRQSGPATLITVPAIVMDRNGRYVANLRKEDFAIYENGVEQNLSSFISVEKPFTVALMLDVSGSTKYQLDEIRQAANTFVSRLRLSDRMMVVTFDGKVNLLADVADVRAIRQSKLHIPAVSDGTALYDAVAFALKRMAQVPGRKAIVLMTDGVDQNSVATLQSTVAGIAEQDVLIYTVQYNTLPQTSARLSFIKNEKARRKVEQRLLKQYATSEPYLRTLAEKTGGRFYKAEDLREVGPAFEAITAELGVQYSLGYYPKGNSTAGAERSIKVRVRYPNLVVRARDSYTTSPAIARQ